MSCLHLLDQQVCQAIFPPLALPYPSVRSLLLYPHNPSFNLYLYHLANFILFLLFLIKFLFGIYSFPPTCVPFCYTSCCLHIYPIYYSCLLVLPFCIVSHTTTGPFLNFLYSNHLYPCSVYAVTLKTDISRYLPNYIDNHNPEDTDFHGSCCENI